jgi:hypothetical protein
VQSLETAEDLDVSSAILEIKKVFRSVTGDMFPVSKNGVLTLRYVEKSDDGEKLQSYKQPYTFFDSDQ